MIEVYRCTAPILARLHARVKARVPPELLVVDRAAGAARNRADLHIAVIDVPAVLALGIAAAGEMRPDPSSRQTGWGEAAGYGAAGAVQPYPRVRRLPHHGAAQSGDGAAGGCSPFPVPFVGDTKASDLG
jgi:hypothetical protein